MWVYTCVAGCRLDGGAYHVSNCVYVVYKVFFLFIYMKIHAFNFVYVHMYVQITMVRHYIFD